MQHVPIRFDYKGKKLIGVADLVETSAKDGVPRILTIYLSGKFIGTLECSPQGWRLGRPADPDLVEEIRHYIHRLVRIA